MKPLFQFIILFAFAFLIISNKNTCSSEEAFDTISGTCINCPYGYNPYNQSCNICKEGQIVQPNGTCYNCSELGNNYAPSKDKTRCILCECNNDCNVSNTTYECYSSKGFVYDKLVTGYYSDEYLLYRIGGDKNPPPDPYPSCIGGYLEYLNKNYNCKCDNGYKINPDDNVCYKSSYEITTIQQMKYSFLENGSKYKSSPLFDSYLFKQYSNQAIAGCQDKIPEKCQMLANLCALRMYDQTSAECSQFLSIQDTFPDIDTTLR